MLAATAVVSESVIAQETNDDNCNDNPNPGVLAKAKTASAAVCADIRHNPFLRYDQFSQQTLSLLHQKSNRNKIMNHSTVSLFPQPLFPIRPKNPMFSPPLLNQKNQLLQPHPQQKIKRNTKMKNRISLFSPKIPQPPFMYCHLLSVHLHCYSMKRG